MALGTPASQKGYGHKKGGLITMAGYMYTTGDEAVLVDVIITSRDRISKLDGYVGYMELTDGSDVLVYNVDGILIGYVVA